jgi:VWFA-related protein
MTVSKKELKTRQHGVALAALVVTAALLLAALTLRLPAQQTAPTTAATPPDTPGGTAHQTETTPQSKPTTIRATVELVNVPVTVKNKRGQPVVDLTAQDFKVYEDGVEQNITHFERETNTPLRIGLIVDTSNTARSRLSYEKDAAAELIYSQLRSGGTKNKVFLQTFDANTSVIQDFTNDPDVLNEKVQDLKPGGGKALYDAIYFACKEKMMKAGPPEEMRRVLVVLSDGLDVQSKHTLDEVVSVARMAETMVYTIGTAAYGFSNPGDKLLADISDSTGAYPSFPLQENTGTDLETGYLSHGQIGDTSQNKGLGAETGKFSAERLVHLSDALEAIGRDLDEQYTIGYKPQRPVMDGTYRTIRVDCERKGVMVRWKPGYFASPE